MPIAAFVRSGAFMRPTLCAFGVENLEIDALWRTGLDDWVRAERMDLRYGLRVYRILIVNPRRRFEDSQAESLYTSAEIERMNRGEKARVRAYGILINWLVFQKELQDGDSESHPASIGVDELAHQEKQVDAIIFQVSYDFWDMFRTLRRFEFRIVDPIFLVGFKRHRPHVLGVAEFAGFDSKTSGVSAYHERFSKGTDFIQKIIKIEFPAVVGKQDQTWVRTRSIR